MTYELDINTIQNRQVGVDVKISGLGFRALNYLITLVGLRLTYIVLYICLDTIQI
jgi:hypothetical protein